MKTAELKMGLIDRIMYMNDDELIKFISIVDEQEGDWWHDLSEEERAEIDEGLKQADEGELTDHSEVMKIFDKWR